MPVTKRSEFHIREAVIEWLEKQGWACYREVVLDDKRADLVARMGNKLWVVECKQLRAKKLIEQAIHWSRFSDMTSVATWKWHSDTAGYADKIKRLGFGYISVTKNKQLCDHEFLPLGNSANPFDVSALLNALDKRQRTSVPGTQGGHHTKWRAMCQDIESFVREHEEATMAQVLEAIKVGSRYGIFGSKELARTGLLKAVKGNYLHGVSMTIREQRHTTKKVAEYIPTFYPKEVAA